MILVGLPSNAVNASYTLWLQPLYCSYSAQAKYPGNRRHRILS